jgi:hypothetical protein
MFAAAVALAGVTLAVITAPHAGALVSAKRAGVTLPPANAQFDYQIGGVYTPPKGVRVVSRDRQAPPVANLYNICYVNAFQSQPIASELAYWRKNNLVLKDASGAEVVDGAWDEVLLDLRTDAKRKAVAAKVNEWITGCATAGFQAVEPDNLDSFSRSEGLITPAHAIEFVKLLATHAHGKGLAIAQKNTIGSEEDGSIGSKGKAAGLDFAVAEQCGEYNECQDYRDLYGNNVIVIEYTTRGYRTACNTVGAHVSVVRRDTDVTPGGPYQAC